MRIDAHHHLWTLARGDYGWLTPDLAPIHRDFGVDDLLPLLGEAGIGATILVQAAPTEAETRHLLGLAAAETRIAGVVGWVDFDAPDTPTAVARLAADPLLVGLRPMVHDIADRRWLCGPHLARTFSAMAELGLVFDALVRPEHLIALDAVAARHPALTIVLDHLGKPDLARKDLACWRADVARLARRPNVVAKLSGLVTEAGAAWRLDDLRPAFAHALEVFGPDRLLWGSDWPVVDLAGGYARWWEATRALLAPLPPGARTGILGANAARVYLTGRGRRITSPASSPPR